MKTILISAISATCIFGFSPQILASTVRQIPKEIATVNSGQPLVLGLAPGYGLNISFIPTGETVEKVWLDDPSWVTVDVDGCLPGLTNSNCDRPGANVLHLRRIKPLNFPGLSRSPSGSSLLTVITRNSSGRRLYLFRIAKVSEIEYHTVEVVNKNQINSPFSRNSERAVDSQTYSQIERGIQVVIERRLLRRGSPLWYRISYFLSRLKEGYPLEQARIDSNISVDLVNRLHQLGKEPETEIIPTPLTTSREVK
ncbi:hypothetical protein [Floridanema evergladense]|uniref:Uncharacterized protein n=1 Tax=Floridaenema evergladense BLCC-F167 TaxID=3153639 RepID=A0ABV4WGN3_9CYAN